MAGQDPLALSSCGDMHTWVVYYLQITNAFCPQDPVPVTKPLQTWVLFQVSSDSSLSFDTNCECIFLTERSIKLYCKIQLGAEKKNQ